MKKVIIWAVGLSIGAGIATYFNNLMLSEFFKQPVDYLNQGSPHWHIAAPVFGLLLTLPVLGYFLGKKVDDER